jgi:hypothetical protein
MKFRGRFIVGASLVGLFALVLVVARVVYGPGESLAPEQLSAVVLQTDDVPGGRQASDCSDELGPSESVPNPDNVFQTAFLFDQADRAATQISCVQSIAAVAESRADAAREMREYERSFVGEIRLIEDVTGSDLDIQRLDTRTFGERSFAYIWRCIADCENEDAVTYIIQFQRANVLSVVVVGAIESRVSRDQAMEYARKQDQRVVAALNAND